MLKQSREYGTCTVQIQYAVPMQYKYVLSTVRTSTVQVQVLYKYLEHTSTVLVQVQLYLYTSPSTVLVQESECSYKIMTDLTMAPGLPNYSTGTSRESIP